MNLFNKIFGQKNKLTARQFYFPYFFDELNFGNLISRFNLTIEVKFNDKTKLASELDIKDAKETKLTIKFWQRLMIENENLTIWSTNKGILLIEKVDLKFKAESKIIEIDISKLEIGLSRVENNLNLTNFISYIRSDKIRYDLDNYENFTIIIITGTTIELIPFDWFNEKGGDYGYVWPALAQIDSNQKLIGSGMRMDNFKVEIRKKAYNNMNNV